MSATLERTFTLDRDLTRRAERKLRRYGRTLDDAVAYAMTIIVSTHGMPDFDDPITLEFSVNGKSMRPKQSARMSPTFGSEGGMLTARLDNIGLDAFAATRRELADEVRSQLAVLWTEYAMADDSDLTESAQKVKRNLLAAFEEV